MATPLILDESITVSRTADEVFAYLAMFSRIEEWDPAVARGTALTPGAPRVGSQFRIDMKAGFSLTYTIMELDPGQRLLMDVQSRLFTAREEIFVEALSPEQSSVRYLAEFHLPAPLALANSIYPGAMVKLGKSTMAGMKRALEDEFEAPEASSATALADRLVVPGMWRFTRFGYRSARRNWQPMSQWLGGRHAVVTGVTSGVGLAIAEQLALLGARLTLVARNEQKAQEIAARLREESGNEAIEVEVCDLSLMSEVHALADRLLQRDEAIDILVNNAGALYNERQETEEGFERSFALLLLSPYILTERLQPLLGASDDPRVINITSGGMYTQRIRVDDLQSERGEFAGAVAYARAKRGLMILTEEWAERWRDDEIAVNAMHPGWADTPGVETSLPEFYRFTRKILRTPEEGADTAVWLAAAPEAGKVSGKLWLDREQHPAHIRGSTVESEEDRAALLEELERLVEETRPKQRRRRRSTRAA